MENEILLGFRVKYGSITGRHVTLRRQICDNFDWRRVALALLWIVIAPRAQRAQLLACLIPRSLGRAVGNRVQIPGA